MNFFFEEEKILGIEREQISHVVGVMKKYLLGTSRKGISVETKTWCKQLRTYLKSWDKTTTDTSAICMLRKKKERLQLHKHVEAILTLFTARGWQAIQSQWNVPLINSVAFDGTYPYILSICESIL